MDFLRYHVMESSFKKTLKSSDSLTDIARATNMTYVLIYNWIYRVTLC